MNGSFKRILPYLGVVLAFLGLSMFFPMLIGILDGDRHAMVFGATGAAGIAAGAGIYKGFKDAEDMNARDAYLLVALAWLLAGAFGAIPYMWHGVLPSFPLAFFETISGFTTTGASVIPDLEILDRSVLLWHSMTFWLGGLGIVVLFVSLLSLIGNSGLQMFRAETTGPMKEKIVPRIRETAKILWLTYIILTVLIIFVLLIEGMGLFDAVCHALGVISTGGFSTKNENVAALSPAIKLTLAFFAMIAGLRIDLYYACFKARSLKPFIKNEEFRDYVLIVLGGVLVTAAALWVGGMALTSALAGSFVQITSAITSTGYVGADYTAWPPAGQILVLLLPFVGACSGSTGGGMKVGRVLIVYKEIRTTFTRIIHPKAIVTSRVNNHTITPEILSNTQSFFSLYILITAVSTVLFCFAGFDVRTSFSIVGACINNVGSAFSQSGPFIYYGDLPGWSMFFLPFLMLIGRLELYTVLILFTRRFWRES
ncbi:MAG: TrkH family potassium uptake protein [Peptococcaceae bacterium]|jgi:trk system potassium uptake protein TrkH|nr:TrkH family potassium uptake protein [Peptococcaceae bacterium]